MAQLPQDVVHAYVAEEMAAAEAWATRCGYDLSYDADALTISLPLLGADPGGGDGGERYLLTGVLDDYRAVPPAWRFVHPDTAADIGPPAYPAGPNPNPRGSTLFTTGGPTGAVICAHFNRLAYAEHDGIHPDWGPPNNWLTLPPSAYTRAETIGDMLARIELEVRESPGRMAPLP